MHTPPSNIKFILLWLLCTTIFNCVTCSDLKKVHCNEKDMNTLLHFKQGVIDPSGLLSSWFTQNDCCGWTGVKCDNITARVIELDLPCHTIKNDSTFIPHKENDDDKSHCLTGYPIYGNSKCDDLSKGTPLHMCRNLSSLQHIDLSHNYNIFIGDLKWISPLSSLQYLNLNGLPLHKEINWLQSVTMLQSLRELHLEGCQLENLYPSLDYANFTSLRVLNLADNHFVSELPTWLFNLSCDIMHIDLSKNKIRGQLSKTLPNHERIKSLGLSTNVLDGPIPYYWLGQFKQLQELDLSYNSFSGPIPTSLGNLSSLIVLDFTGNDFNETLPESLGKLSNLKVLQLASNSFTGTVSPRNLLFLSNLKHLSLSSPTLILDFDAKWVPPFQLLDLQLGYVSHKLPSWIFAQSTLKFLTITDSTASFEPLDNFWNFTTQLQILQLVNNTINADMSNVLLNSNVVWLLSNNLRGGLPRLSQEVVVLNLYNNSLSGTLSPLLCHKMKERGNLKFLEIGSNVLSGELTDCWNDWKSLAFVGLWNNTLSGKIPHSMSSLSNLITLYLNSNKFFGDIPLSLKNCQKLRILDLGDNNFSGAIPSWVGRSVMALRLRSNQFSGNIPSQICQLHSLTVMDFANNQLSGPTPNCLGNITAIRFEYAAARDTVLPIPFKSFEPIFLYFGIKMVTKGNDLFYKILMNGIDLSSNNLSGAVPLEIYMLTGVQSLNLSHNHLEGTISEDIGNLKQLESIDLSDNHFSGEIPKSMSALHYVGVLNLSFNNFMGKIPSGTQLQGFTNLSYMGNDHLCGPPLTKICPQDEKSNNEITIGEVDKFGVSSCFYMGLGIGFAFGFLGVIFFNRTCRLAYFRFLPNCMS
ncbi:hypothetical protein RJT34_24927 [Clitoria ternatea]|uniref:Leucine-rich repeat-containing N-terminal plant-type domain-containing protein n=1 Tax=Clitoria ternatea TaxID=43366 RepID=A0AAN9FVN8_CLITE